MFVKIIKSCRDIVTICDSNLIGKTFENEKEKLEVKESFYSGEEKTPEQVKEIIHIMVREDATFNIVGKDSIKIAIDEGIIDKNCVREIQGIPIAMRLI